MLSNGTVILSIALLSAAGFANGSALQSASRPLLNYMIKSKFSDDPLVSIRCFGHYMPILTNITQKLSTSFQNCASIEKNRTEILNKEYFADRTNVQEVARGIAYRLNVCNDNGNTLDYFDCISGQGNEAQRLLYLITQNSTEFGAELREKYVLVQMDKYKCQNGSEREYIEGTARTYTELNTCLQNDNLPSGTEAPNGGTSTASESLSTFSETTEPSQGEVLTLGPNQRSKNIESEAIRTEKLGRELLPLQLETVLDPEKIILSDLDKIWGKNK